MRWFWLLAAAVLAGGCAKSPAGGALGAKRLTFTMTVAGQIKGSTPGDAPLVYIVALNFSDSLNPTTQGPLPVVAPPWGNGFVAGQCDYFIRWDPTASTGGYLLYQFDPNDPTLINYTVIGTPVTYVQVPGGGNELQFSIDMSQLGLPANTVNAFQSVQVNFLTMDRIPQGGDTGQKVLDSLGDNRTPNGINENVTIPLNGSKGYGPDYGSFTDLEPEGDCSDPDLDIIDWSVQVQIQ